MVTPGMANHPTTPATVAADNPTAITINVRRIDLGLPAVRFADAAELATSSEVGSFEAGSEVPIDESCTDGPSISACKSAKTDGGPIRTVT